MNFYISVWYVKKSGVIIFNCLTINFDNKYCVSALLNAPFFGEQQNNGTYKTKPPLGDLFGLRGPKKHTSTLIIIYVSMSSSCLMSLSP